MRMAGIVTGLISIVSCVLYCVTDAGLLSAFRQLSIEINESIISSYGYYHVLF